MALLSCPALLLGQAPPCLWSCRTRRPPRASPQCWWSRGLQSESDAFGLLCKKVHAPLHMYCRHIEAGQLDGCVRQFLFNASSSLHRATPTHSHQGSQVSETVSEQVATPTATLTHGAPALQEEPLPKAAVEDRALPALQLPGEGEAVTCMVVQVTSPEDFHISLTSNEALSRIKPTDLAPRSWKPGQCGLAHFCGDSSWHRVKVEEVVSTTAQVLYLDYGNRDSIPVTGITAMPPSAWKVPPLAVRCSLVGVGPVGGAREWPHKACLFFSKQALEKTLVLTVKVWDDLVYMYQTTPTSSHSHSGSLTLYLPPPCVPRSGNWR